MRDDAVKGGVAVGGNQDYSLRLYINVPHLADFFLAQTRKIRLPQNPADILSYCLFVHFIFLFLVNRDTTTTCGVASLVILPAILALTPNCAARLTQ